MFNPVLLVIALVFSQSLGEIAKKEKERRKQNAAQGVKAKEFSGSGEPQEGAQPQPAADEKPQPRASGSSRRDSGDEWARIVDDYQKRYDETRKSYEKKLAQMQEMLRYCHNQMGGPQQGIPLATVLGSNVPVGDCTTLPYDIERTKKEMDSELRATEDELRDEARRKDIIPGRARLRR